MDALAYDDRYDEGSGIRLRQGCHFILTGHAHRIQVWGAQAHAGLAPAFAARAMSKGDGGQDHGFSLIEVTGNRGRIIAKRKGSSFGYVADVGVDTLDGIFSFELQKERLLGITPQRKPSSAKALPRPDAPPAMNDHTPAKAIAAELDQITERPRDLRSLGRITTAVGQLVNMKLAVEVSEAVARIEADLRARQTFDLAT